MFATAGQWRITGKTVVARVVAPQRWLDRILAAEHGRFAPWLPVFIGLGATLYFTAKEEPTVWPAAAVVVLLAALAWLQRRAPVRRALALMGLCVALGFAAGSLATWRAAPMPPLPAKAVELTGTVAIAEALPEGGQRVVLSGAAWPGQAPIARTIRLRLHVHDTALPQPGDTIRVRALLRAPEDPAFPGAWDMQRDAFYAGSAGGGMALEPLTILAHHPPSGVAARWLGVRQAIATRLMTDLPGATGAIAATLLTGQASAIPEGDRAAFRDSGLAHLLAVAGLHIAAVMGAVFFALRLLLALSPRTALFLPCKSIAGAGALVAGFLYLLLTGAHVPIERSFAMATLATLALLAGRRPLSWRGLALAATGILLVAPQELLGVSFQMSFAAVAALVAGYEALRPWLSRLHRRPLVAQVAALCLTSLLAGAASAPFGAAHFGQVQLWFVLANLVAVPVTALLVMPAGLLALLLMPLGLEQVALWPMGWGIQADLAIARFVSALPDATLVLPQTPGWGLAVSALALAWLCLWRSRLRLAALPALALGLAAPFLVTPPDVMIAPAARMVGVRGVDTAFMLSKDGNQAFLRDSWLASWGIRNAVRLPRGAGAECGDGWCLVPSAQGKILVANGPATNAPCDQADLIVAARSLCGPGRPALEPAMARNGAVAAWVTPSGPVIETDRSARGQRPWQPPPPTWPRTTLPLAEVEG
jgi:competence protein ComEC